MRRERCDLSMVRTAKWRIFGSIWRILCCASFSPTASPFLLIIFGFTHVDEMVTDLRDICGNLRNVPAVVAHATFNLVCCFGQQRQVGDVLIKRKAQVCCDKWESCPNATSSLPPHPSGDLNYFSRRSSSDDEDAGRYHQEEEVNME
jgi:hypothetical protein